MSNHPFPITNKTFVALLTQWQKAIEYKEAASIYCYARGDVLYRLSQLENQKEIRRTRFKTLFDLTS